MEIDNHASTNNTDEVLVQNSDNYSTTESLDNRVPKKYMVVLVTILVSFLIVSGIAVYLFIQNNQLGDEREEYSNMVDELQEDARDKELQDEFDKEESDDPNDDSIPSVGDSEPDPQVGYPTKTEEISIKCSNVGSSLSALYSNDVNAESSQSFQGYGCGLKFTYNEAVLYVTHIDSYERYFSIKSDAVKISSNKLPGVIIHRNPLELVASGAGSWYEANYGVKVPDSVCSSDLPGGYTLQPPCMKLGVWGGTSGAVVLIPNDKSEELRAQITSIFDDIIKEVSSD